MNNLPRSSILIEWLKFILTYCIICPKGLFLNGSTLSFLNAADEGVERAREPNKTSFLQFSEFEKYFWVVYRHIYVDIRLVT